MNLNRKSKVCSKCNKRRHISLYRYHRDTRDLLNSQCRICEREYTKQWRLKNPILRKAQEWRQALKAKGRDMTPEKYNSMLKSQNGVCAICCKICKSKRRLAIDHCHKTGQIRGLLCGKCNYLIGLSDECEDVLKRAVKYLKSFDRREK